MATSSPLQIITNALRDLNVISTMDVSARAAELELGRLHYNRMVDQLALWNDGTPVTHIQAFTIGTSAQSYTVGPTGTFVTTSSGARPADLIAVKLVVTAATPYFEIPLTRWTKELYSDLATPALSASQPFAYWYNPTTPNGTFYPYPYPTTTTNQFKFVYNAPLGPVAADALSTDIDYANGQDDLIAMELMRRICGPLGVQMTQVQMDLLASTRSAYLNANNRDPAFISTTTESPRLSQDQRFRAGPWAW